MKVLMIAFGVILVGVGLYFSIKNYLNEQRDEDKKEVKNLTVSGKNKKTTATPRKKTSKK